MTSVMSTTGEPEYGQSSPEAVAALTAPPPPPGTSTSTSRSPPAGSTGRSRSGCSRPTVRESQGRAYDRALFPEGLRRQLGAITHDTGRAEGCAR
jgi:hypothetical protein